MVVSSAGMARRAAHTRSWKAVPSVRTGCARRPGGRPRGRPGPAWRPARVSGRGERDGPPVTPLQEALHPRFIVVEVQRPQRLAVGDQQQVPDRRGHAVGEEVHAPSPTVANQWRAPGRGRGLRRGGAAVARHPPRAGAPPPASPGRPPRPGCRRAGSGRGRAPARSRWARLRHALPGCRPAPRARPGSRPASRSGPPSRRSPGGLGTDPGLLPRSLKDRLDLRQHGLGTLARQHPAVDCQLAGVRDHVAGEAAGMRVTDRLAAPDERMHQSSSPRVGALDRVLSQLHEWALRPWTRMRRPEAALVGRDDPQAGRLADDDPVYPRCSAANRLAPVLADLLVGHEQGSGRGRAASREAASTIAATEPLASHAPRPSAVHPRRGAGTGSTPARPRRTVEVGVKRQARAPAADDADIVRTRRHLLERLSQTRMARAAPPAGRLDNSCARRGVNPAGHEGGEGSLDARRGGAGGGRRPCQPLRSERRLQVPPVDHDGASGMYADASDANSRRHHCRSSGRPKRRCGIRAVIALPASEARKSRLRSGST